MKQTLIIIAVAGVLLFDVDSALAWGPATHISLGSSLLDQLSLLPSGVALLLSRHARSYLFGNIAADVVFAKRLSRVKQFCHHWSTGFGLLDRALSDNDRAFAYGYLSHLAADTVAHGKYVPRQIVLSGNRVNTGHLYWELRADATLPKENWAKFDDVLDDEHRAHHGAMSLHLTDTFLSYKLNRILFQRINNISARPMFRHSINILSHCSRWDLPQNLLTAYHGECVDRMVSVLSEGKRSVLLREDPNGTSALMNVHVHRQHERHLRRRGIAISRFRQEACAGLSPTLK